MAKKIRWYTRRSTKMAVASYQRDVELLRVFNDLADRVTALETKKGRRRAVQETPPA